MGLKQDLVFPIAKRWIAGKDMKTGLEAAKEANKNGYFALLNFLGEDVTDPTLAESQCGEYTALQKAIYDSSIKGSVSVKLTQLGLLTDEVVMKKRLAALASAASSMGQQLWLDMEGSRFTDKTLETYRELHETHHNTGVALQAYMRRSEADLSSLIEAGAMVRLVKGAYNESRDLVYGSRKETAENYVRLLRQLFERAENFTVATHDSALIDEARRLSSSHDARFEFGMLRGIRDELKKELVSSGFKVVDYIPYGDQWYSYSVRRIKEHPSNVWLLLRSLV
ncbi:MAG: proline dehydrogenase family protein [Nitrososphaerota archaeon]|nr:proline dehydrogenase family protein [Nitrososphaerota archaeon]